MMYGCENWRIKRKNEKRIEASEMNELRRILQVSWTARRKMNGC